MPRTPKELGAPSLDVASFKGRQEALATSRKNALNALMRRASSIVTVSSPSNKRGIPIKESEVTDINLELLKQKRKLTREKILKKLEEGEFRPAETALINLFLNEDNPWVDIQSAVPRDVLAKTVFPDRILPTAKKSLSSLLGSVRHDLRQIGVDIVAKTRAGAGTSASVLVYYICLKEDEENMEDEHKAQAPGIEALAEEEEKSDPNGNKSRRSRRLGMGHPPGWGWNGSGFSPTEEKGEPEGKTVEPDHFHHWQIEEPNGPLSMGTCVHCGASKEFKNSSEEWEL